MARPKPLWPLDPIRQTSLVDRRCELRWRRAGLSCQRKIHPIGRAVPAATVAIPAMRTPHAQRSEQTRREYLQFAAPGAGLKPAIPMTARAARANSPGFLNIGLNRPVGSHQS